MNGMTTYQLPGLFESLGTPSLKAIAMVFDLKPIRIYSVAKTPKEGEIYDAKVYNWEAVERFILRRLDPDTGLETLEAVVVKALEIDQELSQTDRRKTGTGFYSKQERIVVDGQAIPKRRGPFFEMPANEGELTPEQRAQYPSAHESGRVYVLIKGDDHVYSFVYQTQSHTVLRPIGEDGNWNSEHVRVISNTMLNMKGLSPERANAKEIASRYRAQQEARDVAADVAAATQEAQGEGEEHGED